MENLNLNKKEDLEKDEGDNLIFDKEKNSRIFKTVEEIRDFIRKYLLVFGVVIATTGTIEAQDFEEATLEQTTQIEDRAFTVDSLCEVILTKANEHRKSIKTVSGDGVDAFSPFTGSFPFVYKYQSNRDTNFIIYNNKDYYSWSDKSQNADKHDQLSLKDIYINGMRYCVVIKTCIEDKEKVFGAIHLEKYTGDIPCRDGRGKVCRTNNANYKKLAITCFKYLCEKNGEVNIDASGTYNMDDLFKYYDDLTKELEKEIKYIENNKE